MKKNKAMFPGSIIIYPTLKCNARCPNCSLWPKEGSLVDPESLQQGFSDVLFNDVKAVTFMGGEPTLHPRLPEIIHMVYNRWPNARIVIETNGINVDGIHDQMNAISQNVTKGVCMNVRFRGNRIDHDLALGEIDGGHYNANQVLLLATQIFNCRQMVQLYLKPDFTYELEHVAHTAVTCGALLDLRCAMSSLFLGQQSMVIWDAKAIERLSKALESVPRSLLAYPEYIDALCELIQLAEHPDCHAARSSLVVDPQLNVSICNSAPDLCKLYNVPFAWNRSMSWRKCGSNCFTKQCLMDFPYMFEFESGRNNE